MSCLWPTSATAAATCAATGILYRLTRDHTLVEEMVRHGALPAEEAAQHRWRHVITNAVGADSPEVKVEVHKVHLEGGDRVLLCSDGLTEMVPEEEINRILQTEAEPEQACRRLVTRANEAGGKDNITVVVAHFRAANQPECGHAATGQPWRPDRTWPIQSRIRSRWRPTQKPRVKPPVLVSSAATVRRFFDTLKRN